MTQQRITGGAEPARSKAVSGRERFSQGSLCVRRALFSPDVAVLLRSDGVCLSFTKRGGACHCQGGAMVTTSPLDDETCYPHPGAIVAFFGAAG